MAALLQEIVAIYPAINPPTLTVSDHSLFPSLSISNVLASLLNICNYIIIITLLLGSTV